MTRIFRPILPLRILLASTCAVPFAAFAQDATKPADTSIELPPVTVTASPIAGGGTYVPVTTLDRDALDRQPAQSLGDTLATQPGIASTNYAPGASRPVIRGLDTFRIRMQENGIGSQDVSALGEDHAVPFDPLIADKIEVIRGPATLRWGSQAIGGVVDVQNGRIPDESLPEGTTGRASLGGSFAGERAIDGAFVINSRRGNWAAHADVFGRAANDYRTPDGRQLNSGLTSSGQAVGLSYLGDRGYLGTSFSRYVSDYDVAGGEAAELRKHIDMQQLRWDSRGEYRPAGGPFSALRFWLGFSDYRHDELSLDQPGGTEGVNGTFKNRQWEARLEAQHVPVVTGLGALNGTFGVQYDSGRLRTAGEGAGLIAPANTDSIAGYVFEELSLSDSLKLQAAGRLESVRVKGFAADVPADYLPPPLTLTDTGASRRFLPGSVSIGLSQALPYGMSARLSAAYVERAPSAPELYARGGHDAPGLFEIGDPNLKKEKAKTVELGLSRKEGRVRFDASAFYTRYDGFIFKRFTGNSCDDEFDTCAPGGGGELRQVAYAQADATFYGTELKGDVDLTRLGDGMLVLEGQYDFVRATFSGGDNVPRIPPHRLGGGLSWQNDRWQLGAKLLHAFDQNRTAPLETSTNGYNLLNARVAYTMEVPGGLPVTIGMTGTNLLNDDIRNAVSYKKDEVLQPGRTVRLFTTLTF